MKQASYLLMMLCFSAVAADSTIQPETNITASNNYQSSGGKPVVVTGSSASACTQVYPPAGTSASTHDIVVTGTYYDGTNHEKSHARGVSEKIVSDSGINVCASYTHASYYSFNYTIMAYPK